MFRTAVTLPAPSEASQPSRVRPGRETSGDVTIAGVLVFRRASGPGETARVIWGPDPGGSLLTGFMLSIDLPESALSELPA